MRKTFCCMVVVFFLCCTLFGCGIPPAGTTTLLPTSSATTPTFPSSSQNTTVPTEPATEPTVPATEPTTAPTQPTTQPTQPPLPQTAAMRTVTSTGLYETMESGALPIVELSKDTLVYVVESGVEWATVLWEDRLYYIPASHLREVGRYLVVIDPGHQRYGNLELEPDGPGSSTMKYKVSYGTQGTFTGLAEYELNLLVALKLRDVLESRGYDVVMVRTTHDVDISNAQRAIIANELYADVFIRIHANGSDNPDHNGIMTLCQASDNPYNSHLYAQSRVLSGAVLAETVASTGANRQYVWETNTMSGINWCQVPVTIVEMGYMTNETEDLLMATDAYQQKLALGIANGIDAYFAQLDA